MVTMSSQEVSQAAYELVSAINAPRGEVSIATRLEESGQIGLAVSLSPKVSYMAARVPNIWHGMHVTTQVAEPPKAGNSVARSHQRG